MVLSDYNHEFRLELGEQGPLYGSVFSTLATEHPSRLIYWVRIKRSITLLTPNIGCAHERAYLFTTSQTETQAHL